MEIQEFNKSRSCRFNSNKTFNLIYHAARTIEKSCIKPVFQYLLSDGKEIAGTDARSLHISKIEMKAGMYRVLICNSNKIVLHYEGEQKDHEHKFPNYKILSEKSNGGEKRSISLRGFKWMTLIPRMLHNDIGIDFNRIMKIRHNLDWFIYESKGMDPIRFESQDGSMVALIVPVDMKF